MKAVKAMEEAIVSAKQRRKEQRDFVREHWVEIHRVAAGLDVVSEWIVNITFDANSSLDISVSGDQLVFKGLWGALRKLGYNTNTGPKEEKFSGWSGWFRNPDQDLPLWITFSSTKCTRKKIGTKMVEQPVYELVCE